MAPRLSLLTRTSAVTNPRQLAPTVGLSHDGFEFSKGCFKELKGYAVGRMTKSRRGKIYINDEGWGPDAGRIGEPGPEPNNCTDLIEMAQRARPALAQPVVKRAFVGCLHGGELSEGSEGGGETAVLSDGDSFAGSTNSLYPVRDDGLGGCSDGSSIPDPYEPPSWAGVFMA